MATIRDIATKAGLSPAAVSRILNNDATLGVPEETRLKVINIARELNYVKPKRRKQTTPSFTIGVVQWFTSKEENNDNYYLKVRQGIEDFCVKNTIELLRFFHDDENIMESLKNVDGLICLGKFSEIEVGEFISICSNAVFLDMPVENHSITSLSLDFDKAVRTVIDYLISLGHSEIGFLCGIEYVGNNKRLIDPRTTAFMRYMKLLGKSGERYFKEGEFSSESGYEMMNELLSGNDYPTAVFAASDAIAYGAMRAVHEHGLSIPRDISIIGFNDMEPSAFMTPPLTTIHAPAYDMGQHGANLLFSAPNLNRQTPLNAKLPCRLIIRESCTAPSKK